MTAASGVRPRLMREYSATVGATDGNIIAAIITTHAPRNQPSAPSAVQGPSSIPLIRAPVDHHPIAAIAKRRATRPSCDRAARRAGASPASHSAVAAITRSGGPGELGLRQARLPLVLDPEGADARPLRLGHREIGADRMEHALEPHRLARLDAERDDVLDLEVDPVPDADAVPHAVVLHDNRHALHAEQLADERCEPGHRAAELAAEHLNELVGLLLRRSVVDEHAHPPVALGHDLRSVGDQSDPGPTDVRALDIAFADVEDERDAAEVVGRPVIERQVAWAHQLTRAGLGVAAGQVPSHREAPPSRPWRFF